jgi:hypothetical protein
MATNFPTSVDALTNPVSNDSLNSPSHSAQHTNANDAIEAIESFVLGITGNAWTSYTPTFTNLTVGNGTINAAYNQIGKSVTVRISFTWGSTTSATSSPTTVSLPVTSKSVGTSYGVGTAYMENSGIAGYVTSITINTATSNFAFPVIGTNGLISTNVTGLQPFTWGTADFFQTIFTYEAA